jgi:hypothetical protein
VRDRVVAVVDIGSNSARVVVYGLDAAGQLRIRASSRAALRVQEVDRRAVSAKKPFSGPDALRDFRAMALGLGRAHGGRGHRGDARCRQRSELLRRARRAGPAIEGIDGRHEAEYGFAARSAASRGGRAGLRPGWRQHAGFASRRRRLLRPRAPLGSRLSNRFLADPARELSRLEDYVREQPAGPAYGAFAAAIGTGAPCATSPVDRRRHGWPHHAPARIHAARRRARRRGAGFAPAERRDSVRGLSEERADPRKAPPSMP